MDSIKIEIPKDGTMPHVEGSHAIGVSMETCAEPGVLTVKVVAVPTGDDALHAGSMEAVFTLTAPTLVDQSELTSEEQAQIGGNYADGMIQAVLDICKDNLEGAFHEAARRALGGDDVVNTIASVAMLLASLLVAKHGSKEAAIAHADPRTDPEIAAAAKASGLDDKMMDLLTETVIEAIKLADV